MHQLLAGENRFMMNDLANVGDEQNGGELSEVEKRKSLCVVSRTLEHFLSESEGFESGKLRVGPDYLAISSSGMEVTIKSILFNFDLPVSRYLLIAQNRSGEVVGYRSMALNSSEDKVLTAGSINTVVRNRGISTVIDSANLDLLSRVAANKNKEVVWQISDANKKDGTVTQAEEDEHDRWNSVYGNEGKLQVNYFGSVIISPDQGESLNIEDIRMVVLQKNDSKLYQAVEKTVVGSSDDNSRESQVRVRLEICEILERLSLK